MRHTKYILFQMSLFNTSIHHSSLDTATDLKCQELTILQNHGLFEGYINFINCIIRGKEND